MSQTNKPSLSAKRRSVLRCLLVASAEVTELRFGALLSPRISELLADVAGLNAFSVAETRFGVSTKRCAFECHQA